MILQNWWYTTLMGIKEPVQPPLAGHVKADVLIIGGGAAGLAAALRLMDQGTDVVLLERNICGGSSTGKSAGFLTPDSELDLSQLVRRFGPQGARDLWEVATTGVEIMTSVVKQHSIQCDLVRQDSLFVSNGAAGWKAVQEEAECRKLLKEFLHVPQLMRAFLDEYKGDEENWKKNAHDFNVRYHEQLEKYYSADPDKRKRAPNSFFLYLGRNINYPTAIEGALKLKEISYIPAEGYPSGEMKHGPIALIDENPWVICLATESKTYDKMISNIQEIRARGGYVIPVVTRGNEDIQRLGPAYVIEVPQVLEIFSPLVNILPLQLLAYCVAREFGEDIDQPRNLAKSVTVE